MTTTITHVVSFDGAGDLQDSWEDEKVTDSGTRTSYLYLSPWKEQLIGYSVTSSKATVRYDGTDNPYEVTQNVEIKNGEAKVSGYPIPGSTATIEYGDNTNLGSITIYEDGTIKTGVKAYTMARVTFKVRRHRFIVTKTADFTNQNLKDVQILVEL